MHCRKRLIYTLGYCPGKVSDDLLNMKRKDIQIRRKRDAPEHQIYHVKECCRGEGSMLVLLRTLAKTASS